MKILGIDPGYAIVGYGLVKQHSGHFSPLDCGVLTTPQDMPFPKRLKSLYDMLTLLIAEKKPDVIAIETLFFNTNVTTAIAVGHARGVLILAAENAGVPVFEYTPLQIKQAITGYGRADKIQMQQMVKMLLGLAAVPKPDDAADALAVAICHGQSFKLNQKIGEI